MTITCDNQRFQSEATGSNRLEWNNACKSEMITDIAKRSLSIAFTEVTYFSSSRFYCRRGDFFSCSLLLINPSISQFKTDCCIPLEIYRAPQVKKQAVLLFSNGYGETSSKYSLLLQRLATQGLTVLNISHPASSKAAQDLSLNKEAAHCNEVAQIVANNIVSIVDWVKTCSFKNDLDFSQIFVAGHSLGGAASIIASRGCSDIKGCINLDGFLIGKDRIKSLSTSLLMIVGDLEKYKKGFEGGLTEKDRDIQGQCKKGLASIEEYSTLTNNSPDAELLIIPGSEHMDFSDESLYQYQLGFKSYFQAMRVHDIFTTRMLEFIHH